MQTKTKATIRGIVKRTGKPFVTTVEFELYKPTDDNHYGTGYWMGVLFENGYDTCVDVRYERTTNLIVLAKRFVHAYWGESLQEVSFT